MCLGLIEMDIAVPVCCLTSGQDCWGQQSGVASRTLNSSCLDTSQAQASVMSGCTQMQPAICLELPTACAVDLGTSNLRRPASTKESPMCTMLHP